MQGDTCGRARAGTPVGGCPAARSCGPAPPAFNFWEGGRENRTFGASGVVGRWVGAGGSRDGDVGIGKQVLQPIGLSETLPRPPPLP